MNWSRSRALAFSLQKQRAAIRLWNRKAMAKAIQVASQASRKPPNDGNQKAWGRTAKNTAAIRAAKGRRVSCSPR
jgi:hypothetical protein